MEARHQRERTIGLLSHHVEPGQGSAALGTNRILLPTVTKAIIAIIGIIQSSNSSDGDLAGNHE